MLTRVEIHHIESSQVEHTDARSGLIVAQHDAFPTGVRIEQAEWVEGRGSRSDRVGNSDRPSDAPRYRPTVDDRPLETMRGVANNPPVLWSCLDLAQLFLPFSRTHR
jgi:hypothetical protein